MNNFELHNEAQQMCDTQSKYQMAKMAIELEDENQRLQNKSNEMMEIVKEMRALLIDEWLTLYDSAKNPDTGCVEDVEENREILEELEYLADVIDRAEIVIKG